MLDPRVRYELGERVGQERRVGCVFFAVDEEGRYGDTAQQFNRSCEGRVIALAQLLAVEGVAGVGDLAVEEMERRLLPCHPLACWRGNSAACHVGPRRCRIAVPFG